MSKRLIISADDFGYAEGSVPAIVELYEAGLVTSTTALVNQPHWPEAAACLREHPSLGTGVHLVMNEGPSIFSLYVSDEHRTTDYLLGLLDALSEGTTELVTHPGTEGWRDKERRALLDPRVKARIEELDIELITYGNL
jgi:predicted glycoside hydrolase/deacetylase ChbG (UPF0249 family)